MSAILEIAAMGRRKGQRNRSQASQQARLSFERKEPPDPLDFAYAIVAASQTAPTSRQLEKSESATVETGVTHYQPTLETKGDYDV